MLARHRAQQPPPGRATTPGSALTSTPDSGQRWPGRSPIPRAGTGTAGSRRCSRPAYRRRWSAGSWRRKGSWRTCPSDAGMVPTRARRRRLPPISSTGTCTAERPNEKWLTDITEIKARDGKVYLSPMIDCFDGKIVAYTAGFSPNAELANRMLEKKTPLTKRPNDAAGERASPGAFRPWMPLPVARMARWLMERFGLTRSMSASPGAFRAVRRTTRPRRDSSAG